MLPEPKDYEKAYKDKMQEIQDLRGEIFRLERDKKALQQRIDDFIFVLNAIGGKEK